MKRNIKKIYKKIGIFIENSQNKSIQELQKFIDELNQIRFIKR